MTDDEKKPAAKKRAAKPAAKKAAGEKPAVKAAAPKPKKTPAVKAAPAPKAAAKPARKAPEKTVKVTQIASPIGRQGYQLATLKGLGLNKLNRSRVLEDTPAVRGMIERVKHLLRIEAAQ